MLRFLVYFHMLVAVTICPASAQPGKRLASVPASSPLQTKTSPPTTTSKGTTTATISEATTAPSQSIIVAEIGSDEWLADGKTKWLTYWVSEDQEPDWCNGANSTRTVTNANDDLALPNLFYGTDNGDPSSLDGCSYDSNANTWGCDGWSASCKNQYGTDKLGFPVFGATVATCDGLDITELIICLRDAASSTATQTIEAPSSTATVEASYTASCEDENRDLQTWQDYKMDDFLDNLAQNIPEGNTGTFIELIESKASGIETFSCDFELSGGGTCQVDLNKCDASNARYYFVLDAIVVWHVWVSAIQQAFDWSKGQFSSQASDIVSDFVRTSLPANNMWIATLIAGIFGAISGIFAVAIEIVPAMAATALVISGSAGASSGATTMVNGIVSGQLQNADAVIQNELNSLADLENYVTSQINTTMEGILDNANAAINGPATNDPTNHYYYMSANNSIASILQGGGFASDKLGNSGQMDLFQTAVNAMWSASIAYLWLSQNVIIVKLSTSIRGATVAPCDILLQKGFQRSCDGDTAYFYGILGTNYADTSPIYGADDDTLGKYGLNMVSAAQAANATQERYGFAQNFNTATAQKTVQDAYESLNETFMPIPFCDLDALEDKWSDIDLVNLDNIITDELRLLYLIYNICGAVTVEIDGKPQSWPVDGYGSSV